MSIFAESASFFFFGRFSFREKEKMIVKSKRRRGSGAQDEPLGSYIFVKSFDNKSHIHSTPGTASARGKFTQAQKIN